MESRPQIAIEYKVGVTEVPVLQHTGCSSLRGIVTKLDEHGYPSKARCLTGGCSTRSPIIDRARLQAQASQQKKG